MCQLWNGQLNVTVLYTSIIIHQKKKYNLLRFSICITIIRKNCSFNCLNHFELCTWGQVIPCTDKKRKKNCRENIIKTLSRSRRYNNNFNIFYLRMISSFCSDIKVHFGQYDACILSLTRSSLPLMGSFQVKVQAVSSQMRDVTLHHGHRQLDIFRRHLDI